MSSLALKVAGATAASTLQSNLPSLTASDDGKRDSKTSTKSKQEDEPLLTWKDLLLNPCLFIPLIILTGAGGMGCIGFLVFLVITGPKMWSFQIVMGLTLAGAGLLAAFEVRILGTLSEQIEHLKLLRKKLEAHTNELTNQVGGIESENLELEENVATFRERNEQLANTVDEFDDKNKVLRNLHGQLEKQSEILKEETRGIRVQSEKLNATVLAMGEQHDALTESLKDFDELRNSLNAMAEESGEQFSDLIYKTSETFQKMDDLVHDNEKVLLHQLIADVEYFDDSTGMQEKEYRRFLARLPKRYKEIIKSKGIEFSTFDTDGSGVIDIKEIKDLVDNLVEEVNKTEQRKRRPGL